MTRTVLIALGSVLTHLLLVMRPISLLIFTALSQQVSQATNVCEKIDGDCTPCAHPWLSGHSPVALVPLSDPSLISAATAAQSYLRNLDSTKIQSFDNPNTGLHTSLFYFCCHNTEDIQNMKRAFKQMQWNSFPINYNSFSCNNDHDNKTVYLHALPTDQSLLFDWATTIENTLQQFNVTVNHPRKSKFHMTLARVDPSYPIATAVSHLNATDFGSHTLCSFTFEGETYFSTDGCVSSNKR